VENDVRIEAYDGPAPNWDEFVRRQPGWTYCHLWGWRRVIEGTFGHPGAYLAARADSGEIVGVLPLVWVRSRLFGRFLVSVPFLNYGGPLGEPAASRELAGAAARLIDRETKALLELRCRAPLNIDLTASERKVTVLLDLPDTADELWGSLPSKVRSQVRRPQKEGMEARFGTDQRASFYDVFTRHMRDLGTPVLPRRFFDRIAEQFPDSVRFGCVYHEGRPVAAGCGFRWGDELEMTWASSLRSHSRMAPNMLLYWSFFEKAIDESSRIFNFGRCSPGSGTHRFKRQWGGRDQQLLWYQRATDNRAKTPSPDDSAYAWGARAWSLLPLPIANRLGPAIVKYIP
jgi:FemAB-related protein (PEP-CTERM system-associated)